MRGIIDRDRAEKGRFILTGSSSLELLRHIPETLAGRVGIIELGTLRGNEHWDLPLSPFYEIFDSTIDERTLTTVTNWNAHYYRTRGAAEIDLILEGPFGVLPIEIKYNSYTSARDLMSLTAFLKEGQLPLGIVVNNSEKVEQLTTNIVQLPAGAI